VCVSTRGVCVCVCVQLCGISCALTHQQSFFVKFRQLLLVLCLAVTSHACLQELGLWIPTKVLDLIEGARPG
jgi:hypothetical protein